MYVIGKNDYTFVKIKFETIWDGYGRVWNKVAKVFYDCFEEDATIFRSLDKVQETFNEIQNGIDEIDFENITILGNLIDKDEGFDKVDYAKQLKIYELVPQLVNKEKII